MAPQPITITLTFETAEQAQHVLEAYGEARAMSPGVSDATVNREKAAAYSNGAVRELANQLTARDLPDGGTSRMYPTNADGSLALTQPADAGATGGRFDLRGVPHHPQHHGETMTEDGAWKRRRGHNRALADAYEAQFLAAAKPTAAGTVMQAGNSPQPAAADIAASEPAPQMMPAPSPVAVSPVAVPYVPTQEEYRAKWIELCQTAKITGEHQKQIEQHYGAHPCAPQLMEVDATRAAIWPLFMQWSA